MIFWRSNRTLWNQCVNWVHPIALEVMLLNLLPRCWLPVDSALWECWLILASSQSKVLLSLTISSYSRHLATILSIIGNILIYAVIQGKSPMMNSIFCLQPPFSSTLDQVIPFELRHFCSQRTICHLSIRILKNLLDNKFPTIIARHCELFSVHLNEIGWFRVGNVMWQDWWFYLKQLTIQNSLV